MSDNTQALVLASFIADAFSLGPHWIYDTEIIDREFGNIDALSDPLPNSFHATKSAGDFTHYGDQTLLLLESIASCDTFDLNHFASHWQASFSDYDGYIDQATKATLKNMDHQMDSGRVGSLSTDLGGASRIAPLVYRFAHNREHLESSVKAQTQMTHNNELVIECALFFAMATLNVLKGQSPLEAVQTIADESFDNSPLSMLVQKGIASRTQETRHAISTFGQMCDSHAAFPSAIHLIAKYPEEYANALKENAKAGGDSAARGMLTGMLLGAYQGKTAIPATWLSQMKAYPKIKTLLSEIDAKNKK